MSGTYIFETSDIIASQSFPVGLPDPSDRMTWLIVAQNSGSQESAAAAGVICADENEGANKREQDIDIRTKVIINNIINNIIKVQNNQIINLNQVINIRQEIVQNAIQIAQITGNNNTVNQVIQQSANQIASANTTNPTQIQQIINQNAQQQGVTSPGTTLSQIIEQQAQQQANVTGGGGANVEGFLGQNAAQLGNTTTGAGGIRGGEAEQSIIPRGEEQGANVTSEEQQPTDLQQLLEQQAQQQANVTGGGGANVEGFLGQNRSAIGQQIEQGQQQAQTEESDDTTTAE